MSIEAVASLGEKNGSSLQSIRKYIISSFCLKPQHMASFNALTLKAVNRAVAQGELERLKNTFKLTSNEKERRREKEKLRITGENILGSSETLGGVSRSDIEEDNRLALSSLHGSVLESNRHLRRAWEAALDKRDRFLMERYSDLKPFLPEKVSWR
jgi:hypothetical protein